MPARFLIIAVILLPALLCAGKAHGGENRKPTEYEVKAAYIYNFAKFVEWPNDRIQDGRDTIQLCVLGDDPFGRSLATIVGKSAGERKISVKQNVSLQNMQGCEIVFVSGSEEEHLGRIVKALNGSPALTRGDTEGFAGRGVMINFYLENRTVRFEINQRAAKRAGFRISSNLLRIARIVEEP
jgi:hypothetical protein